MRDALDQRGAVHAVGNLRNDDLLAGAFEFFNAGFAAHFHAAPAGLEILANAVDTADDAASGKIRSLHVLRQLIQCDVRVVDLCANSINHLGEIMRRNIGRHAHCDSGAAVYE